MEWREDYMRCQIVRLPMDGNKIETQRNTIDTQYEYIRNTIEIQ